MKWLTSICVICLVVGCIALGGCSPSKVVELVGQDCVVVARMPEYLRVTEGESFTENKFELEDTRNEEGDIYKINVVGTYLTVEEFNEYYDRQLENGSDPDSIEEDVRRHGDWVSDLREFDDGTWGCLLRSRYWAVWIHGC